MLGTLGVCLENQSFQRFPKMLFRRIRLSLLYLRGTFQKIERRIDVYYGFQKKNKYISKLCRIGL